MIASGGTESTVGAYKVHTFTGGANLVVSEAGTCEVLVVAGGGSGGGSQGTSIASGGGGGGGVIYNSSYTVTIQTYTITIGNGGTGVAGFVAGGQGQNSVFGSLTAIGGGYGGTWTIVPTVGGSGGGAGENGQALDGAVGTAGQGYAGGNDNGYDSGAPSAGGGGGGASGIGGNSTTDTIGGNGGIGYMCEISGNRRAYGGGGGGAGSTTAGSAGYGGGGGGRGVTTGTGGAGTANTGGGGGGSLTNVNEAAQPGGNGGTGIVIVRYLIATTPTVVDSTDGSGRKIYKYLTPGYATYTPVLSGTCEVLIVAGGGGGGFDMGGGGGGGGVISDSTYDIEAGVPINIVIGGGGNGAPAGGSAGQGGGHQFQIGAGKGQNSTFGGFTSIGGGYGGSSYRAYSPNYGVAGIGGSGGGASGYNDNAGTFYGGVGTSGQGNRGGNSTAAYYSGGGGGAGGAGADSTGTPHGGVGVSNSILETAYYWGGGGGGAAYSLANGGNGGNGGGGGGAVGTTTGGAGLNAGSAGGGGSPNAQTNTPGGNAGANTGGGGGGGSHYYATNAGGNGGSGIVVMKITEIATTTNYLSEKPRRIKISGNLTGKADVSSRLFPMSGLTNFWKFENSAVDEIGRNNGTTSSITYAAGKQGNGAIYNANTDYITITPITSSTITIAGWYYYGAANTGNWNTVFCKDGGNFHHILINGDSKIIGFYNGAWYPSSLTMTTGAWYFIVCEKVGINEKIYVNNNLVLDSNGSFDNLTAGGFGIIGNYVAGATQGPIGTIDEVGVWNRILTAEEKTYLYNSGNGVNDRIATFQPTDISECKVWVDVSQITPVADGTSITSITDLSGNGANLTQVSAGQNPKYYANVLNGLPVMRHTLAASSTWNIAWTHAAPNTFFYVAKRYSANHGRALSSKNNNWLMGYWNVYENQAYFEGWIGANSDVAATTNPYTWSAEVNSTSNLWKNGTLVKTGTGGVTAPSGLCIGCNGATEFSDTDIGEIIGYNRALTTAERQTVENYLRIKWGTG